MLCVSLKDVDATVWESELVAITSLLQSLSVPEVSIDDSAPYAWTTLRRTQQDRRPKLISGFCYQVYDGVSVPNADDHVTQVYGEMCITEEMLGCRFEVSPQAFFQVILFPFRI